jgi:hypothetical protein
MLRDNFSSDAPHMSSPEPLEGREFAAWVVVACLLLAVVIGGGALLADLALRWWEQS